MSSPSLSSDEFADYYEGLMNNRQTQVNDGKQNFKWAGFNDLGPALSPGDMVMVAAESGVGKSTFLENQAEYLWQEGFHGVFYYFELIMDKMAEAIIEKNGPGLKRVGRVKAQWPEIQPLFSDVAGNIEIPTGEAGQQNVIFPQREQYSPLSRVYLLNLIFSQLSGEYSS